MNLLWSFEFSVGSVTLLLACRLEQWNSITSCATDFRRGDPCPFCWHWFVEWRSCSDADFTRKKRLNSCSYHRLLRVQDFKILKVLRSIMLAPIGIFLTNSSVCEIMQSCFQICFESRLGGISPFCLSTADSSLSMIKFAYFCVLELLRKSAEVILVDMVQLLFARLPQFKEDLSASAIKKVWFFWHQVKI